MGRRRGGQAVLGAVSRGLDASNDDRRPRAHLSPNRARLNLSPNQDKSSFWSQDFWSQDEEKDARNAAA
jgi:hypothetical protein